MERPANLSQVISSLYDCAIVPDLWPRALPLLANYMNSHTAAVGSRSRIADKPHFFVEFGFDQALHELYVSKFRSINPRINAMALFGVDEPVRTEDILDMEEFHRSIYYKEFHLPQAIGEILTSKVIEDGHRTVAVNVSRPEPYSSDDIERLRELCPHIRRVMTIADLLERRTVERDSLAEVLDRLSVAVILVDPKQKIMHANEAAREFLATEETLSSVHGVLTANSSRDNASLRHAAQAPDLDTKQLPLETTDGRVMLATVLPLTSGLREAYGKPLSASAAVFVHNQPAFDESLTSTLIAAFGLTGAEARILCALLEGLSLADVVDRHQISIHTVKTHLQKLFDKTNTNRQSDLIRLASNAIPPIRPAIPSHNKHGGVH